MANCPFCNLDEPPATPTPNAPAEPKRPAGFLHRAWRTTQWLAPAIPIPLLFIPKCPMCVVAYVALFTGIGISISTARWIETLVPLSCLTLLASLAIMHWRSRPTPNT